MSKTFLFHKRFLKAPCRKCAQNKNAKYSNVMGGGAYSFNSFMAGMPPYLRLVNALNSLSIDRYAKQL